MPCRLRSLKDCTSCGPPTLSITRSIPSFTSSRLVTTRSAPSSVRPAALASDPTEAITRAPPNRASWIAKRPTPPEAPVIRTVLPKIGPLSCKVASAVTAAVGSVAASAGSTPSGMTAISSTCAMRFSAQAPSGARVTTNVPMGGALVCGPTATITPDASHPRTVPSASRPRAPRRVSPKFSEVCVTSISTSP